MRRTEIEALADAARALRRAAHASQDAGRIEVANNARVLADAVETESLALYGSRSDRASANASVGLSAQERIGALARIFDGYKPAATPYVIQRAAEDIDSAIMGSRFARWQTSREGTRTVKIEIRKALKRLDLPATGDLFERAYSYVAENY